MNIKEYASKPELVKVIITDKEILEKYKEEIEFYTYDIVPMSTYFEFFNARSNHEFDNLAKIMRKLILDQNGKPALTENEDLPIDIAAAAINKIGEMLGKSQSKTSIPTIGDQPE